MIYYINENKEYDIFESTINAINDIDNLYIDFVQESYVTITEENSDKESIASTFAKTIANIFKRIGTFFAELAKKVKNIINKYKSKYQESIIKIKNKNAGDLNASISEDYYDNQAFKNTISRMNDILDNINDIHSSGRIPRNVIYRSSGSLIYSYEMPKINHFEGTKAALINIIKNIKMYDYANTAEDIYTKIANTCNKVADRFLAEASSISVDYISEKRKDEILDLKSSVISNGSKQLRILNSMIKDNESLLNKILNQNSNRD